MAIFKQVNFLIYCIMGCFPIKKILLSDFNGWLLKKFRNVSIINLFSFQFQLYSTCKGSYQMAEPQSQIHSCIQPFCSLQQSHVTAKFPATKLNQLLKLTLSFVPYGIVSSMSVGYLVVIQKGIQTTHCYKAADNITQCRLRLILDIAGSNYIELIFYLP